jgi:diguanylate cyclase (GGDEF)-like protein/PAS domain S-box-containing protein
LHTDGRLDAALPQAGLKGQNQMIVDLARRPSLHSGDLGDAVREITDAAAKTLGVERVSVWLFTPDRKAIQCIDLYEMTPSRHTDGAELLASQYPVYFRALESERTITAHDALHDPRTAAFSDTYLIPLGISSMVDAPIRHRGQIAGVVCIEHVGPLRYWTVEEESFAGSLADLVAMALDAADRHKAQESLGHRLEFEKLISGISTTFLNIAPADLDDGIREALEAVSRFIGADRAYIYMTGDDPGGDPMATLTHEWSLDPARNLGSGGMSVPWSAFPWTSGILRQLDSIAVSVDEMPPEAAAEREMYERAGNRAIIAVPMIQNRKLVGVLGAGSVQSRKFSGESVVLLRIIGEIFVNAINRHRAEAALRASEERHRLLFERNLAGVYRNTIDGRILDCNEALAHMLGYESREELMRCKASDLYIKAGERDEFIDALRRDGHRTSVEICLRRKDGRPVWLVESVHLLSGGDGEPEVLEGTLIDITDRKRAETALRESEMRYRLLIERMREGVAQVDTSEVIQFVNDRFCDMVGYSREELIGQSARTLLAYPEDHELMDRQQKMRLRGASDQYEVRVRRKDGSVVWIEIGGAPVTDATGRVIGSIGVHNDVTSRRLAEEALRESEARYRLMAENSTDMIARTDRRGTILYASDASRRLLGYEPAEVIGRSVYDFIYDDDREEFRYLSRLINESGQTTFAYRVRKRDGALVWFETTSRAVRDAEANGRREVISVSRDVTERKQVEEQIEYQAYHDALTGLPNRRLFRDRLTVALAYARRMKRPLGVMFLDLDRFKYVNDTLGHSLGDELLKAVAGRLRAVLREEDSIARMGGDEFTVLLADLPNPDEAAKVAQKLLDTIAQTMCVEEHELFITTSIGIAFFPNDGDTAESLLKNADQAMYRAKDAGRNAYQMFTPAMNNRALERLSLENSLRGALDRGEFVLHYQPQLHLATNRITGVEALIRWNRPDHGIVPPATFIPIAEDTRLIVPIGEWVLRESCRTAKAWQDAGFPGMRMAVNLSPRQFQSNDLPTLIAAALAQSRLDPGCLELEITESIAMQNTDRTMATLRRLREMGVRIAIDDFGAGYSSLNYLRNFPIDSVKIDQQFVHGIETSQADRAIVAAIIRIAHGLGLRITAEGVETPAQLAFLREHNCEEVQGFLFGGPSAELPC